MLRTDVGHIQVEFAIIVIVDERGAHPSAVSQGIAFDRDIGKSAVAIVAIKGLAAEIVYHIKVWKAVIIKVTPDRAQAQSCFSYACLFRHISKSAVTVIVVKLVRFSVAGVKRGGNVFTRVHVSAHVEVKKAVIVIVGPRRYGGAAIFTNAGFLCDVSKSAIAIVVEQLVGLEGAAYEEVFMSVIVIVGKHGHTGAIKTGKAGLPGHVFKRAITTVAVEL